MSDTHPTHLGHVHLKVRDIDRALDFYIQILGLELTERHGRYAFCSWGEHHHDVALQGLSEDAPNPGPGVGLYHAAFEVASGEALRNIFERLQDREIPVSPVDHGISKAIYFDDPAGNGLEVYLDTRDQRDQYEWEGQNEPFDPTEL
jgi:catechol 2,3-dioxygenase